MLDELTNDSIKVTILLSNTIGMYHEVGWYRFDLLERRITEFGCVLELYKERGLSVTELIDLSSGSFTHLPVPTKLESLLDNPSLPLGNRGRFHCSFGAPNSDGTLTFDYSIEYVKGNDMIIMTCRYAFDPIKREVISIVADY